MLSAILVLGLVVGGAPVIGPNTGLAEKIRADLLASRRCEAFPDSGGMVCHYRYRNVRFAHWTLRDPATHRPIPQFEIERVDAGRASITLGGTLCVGIGLTANDPREVAAVEFNVIDGKIYIDARDGHCTAADAAIFWQREVAGEGQ